MLHCTVLSFKEDSSIRARRRLESKSSGQAARVEANTVTLAQFSIKCISFHPSTSGYTQQVFATFFFPEEHFAVVPGTHRPTVATWPFFVKRKIASIPNSRNLAVWFLLARHGWFTTFWASPWKTFAAVALCLAMDMLVRFCWVLPGGGGSKGKNPWHWFQTSVLSLEEGRSLTLLMLILAKSLSPGSDFVCSSRGGVRHVFRRNVITTRTPTTVGVRWK